MPMGGIEVTANPVLHGHGSSQKNVTWLGIGERARDGENMPCSEPASQPSPSLLLVNAPALDLQLLLVAGNAHDVQKV
jgi:hypothetical protein